MASEACCNHTPVVPDKDSYQIKGDYTTVLNDMRTYVVNVSNNIINSAPPKTGILVIYDVFGLDFPQTLQGCDILGQNTNSVVVMPDFFRGEPISISNYPPDTPAKQEAFKHFFATKAEITATIKTLNKIVPEIKERFPYVEKWAVVGYCWGAKIATLLSSVDTPFAGTAQLHPAMLDPNDATKFTIPCLIIATNGENKDAVLQFGKMLEKSEVDVVKEKSEVLYWDDIFHGFMSARADLKDQTSLAFYEKGYNKLTNWLNHIFEL